MTDTDDDSGLEAQMREAFHGRYTELEREADVLRQRGERQSVQIADLMARERTLRKMVEDQYQLLQVREGEAEHLPEPGPLLTIPVAEAMDLTASPAGAPAPEGDAIADWLAHGGQTDGLVRTATDAETAGAAARPSDGDAAEIYRRLGRPIGLGYRPSPGLAAFALRRGELRALGFNLIGAADDRLEHLAEEIAQAVALNRKFAPVIFTTTRAGLNAFRRRRLTYESLPVFDATIARLTGVETAKAFYDIRVGYLIRKWRITAVMNLGESYAYATGA